MTTPNKIAANRQNALRSTGPRTSHGKAVVSQNAARGGLFASGSILPGLESRARWQEHLQATLSNLAPVGQVEVALAERVALILWRLCRVSTFEQDVTHRARVRSYVEMLAKRQPLFAIEGADTINDVLERLTRARAQLRALQRFVSGTPDTMLAGSHADLILTAIAQQICGFKIDTFSAPEIVPDGVAWAEIPDWTIDRLRRLVEAIASATDREPRQLLAAATDAARDALNRERAAQRSFDRQIRDLRAERVLPESVPLDRLLRYEDHLTRQLDQTLKQLRALQLDRRSTSNQDTAPYSSASSQPHDSPAAPILLPLSAPVGAQFISPHVMAPADGEGSPSVTNPPSDQTPPSHAASVPA